MKVLFGSTYLARGDVESAGGVSLNGQQINVEAQFCRALAATFFARGQRSASFGFYVTRRFNSVREANRFAFEHFSTLPEQDELSLHVGSDADGEWIKFAAAVIDVCSCTPLGTTVTVQYGFRVATVSTDVPPPTVTEPTDEMIKRGETAIGAGDDTVNVVFSTPFSGTPIILQPHVELPSSGGDKIFAHVVKSSISAAGFTAVLTAPTPASGYYLAWGAIA